MMLEELLGEARRDFTVRPEQAKRVQGMLYATGAERRKYQMRPEQTECVREVLNDNFVWNKIGRTLCARRAATMDGL